MRWLITSVPRECAVGECCGTFGITTCFREAHSAWGELPICGQGRGGHQMITRAGQCWHDTVVSLEIDEDFWDVCPLPRAG